MLRDNCVLSHSSCDSASSHHLLKNYCHHLETGWQPYTPCIPSTNSQLRESNGRVCPWKHPSNKPEGHMVLRNRSSICIQVIQDTSTQVSTLMTHKMVHLFREKILDMFFEKEGPLAPNLAFISLPTQGCWMPAYSHSQTLDLSLLVHQHDVDLHIPYPFSRH